MLDALVGDTLTHAIARSSVRVVDHVSELCEVFEDDANVVSLSRRLDPELVAEARGALAHPFRVVTTASPSDGVDALAAQMPGLPRIAADIFFWTEVLADITGCDLVGVRLARVEAAMCPRFHVDRVVVRIVSAFAGLGTEYLAEEDVDRRWLGRGSLDVGDESSGLLQESAQVRRAETGDVVLLKGEGWPGNQGRGAVHRSPSASRSAPRLVMTLDPL